jgi:hypothetical protein
MQDLLEDETPMGKIGDFRRYKKDKSTAKDTPPTGNERWMEKLNTVRPSSITDTFKANDPRQVVLDIKQQENEKREADRMFIESLKKIKEEEQKTKEEEQKTRQTTFSDKQLSRTTNKYTAMSESRKRHQGNKRAQGGKRRRDGKYSRIKRKRVTRKGMRKTSSKSRKHYKRR